MGDGDAGKRVDYSGVYNFLTSQKSDTTTATVSTITDNSGAGAGISGGYTIPEGGIVQCGKAGPLLANGKQACSFADVIKLINSIIKILLFIIAPAIATCIVLYAGLLMLTSGGNTESVSKAKGLFSKAVIGLVIALCAWLLIKFILDKIGYNVYDPSTGFGFPKFY